MQKNWTRRRFLKTCLRGAGLVAVAAPAYPYLEAQWCMTARHEIYLPHLPRAFDGLRVTFLSDIHHGPFVPIGYIRRVVEKTNAGMPDIILLGGDYVFRHSRYIAPCHEALSRLHAPLGIFAVRGNHDYFEDRKKSAEALKQVGITEFCNSGVWVQRGGERLRICGVEDLWCGRPDFDAAAGDAGDKDAIIMMSHNPDYLEMLSDPRPGLALCGHTHGGQVRLPGYGAPILPSKYGQKYAYGFVQAPSTLAFVSSGVGTVTPPVRLLRPPEIVELTLRCPPPRETALGA